MTSTPYPTFLNAPPIPSLGVLNRIRFHSSSLSSSSSSLDDITSKCREIVTAHAVSDKKLAKKCQKQATALASQYISEELNSDPSIIAVELSVSLASVTATEGYLVNCLLDAGVDKVVLLSGDDEDDDNVVGSWNLGDVLEQCRVPASRIAVHFTCSETLLSYTASDAAGYAGTVGFTCTDLETVQLVRNQLDHDVELVISVPSFTDELKDYVKQVTSLNKCRVTLVDPTAETLGQAYVACLKTDREDGMFTTVVVTRSGEALGLVYSSEESLIASLTSPRAIYYSRSRNSLWRKGDTSGHFQLLHRIDVDCDGDALLFTVTQCGEPHPAFCHLKTLTCWNEPRGVRHLEQTLKQRLRDAPEGSYTKRLFEDCELLRDKLVEEAMELSEATEKQHVAEELADVIYFAMVKAVKCGVGMDDAVRELDKRSKKVTRRKGDSKVERIEMGKEILDKIKKEEGK